MNPGPKDNVTKFNTAVNRLVDDLIEDLKPADARPTGRDYTVHMFPSRGAWTVWCYDENGGFLLEEGVIKPLALAAALKQVWEFNAEFVLRNEWTPGGE